MSITFIAGVIFVRIISYQNQSVMRNFARIDSGFLFSRGLDIMGDDDTIHNQPSVILALSFFEACHLISHKWFANSADLFAEGG